MTKVKLTKKMNSTKNQGIPTLSLKDKSDIYIISTDNIPQCYTNNLENARVRMWDLARYVKSQESQFHRCYLREDGNRNSIQLNGTSRFFLISYEHTLVRFSHKSYQRTRRGKKYRNSR